MKNIFIGGVAKSGKSTIAMKVCKNSEYNHIPVDYFASSLKHNFKDLGINSNVVIEKGSSEKLALLLSRVMSIIGCKNDKYIIDSAHILPIDIAPYVDKENFDVYFVGYPNITKEEKFKIIREYDKNEWTNKRSDEELMGILDKLVELSKEIEKQCAELGFNFIDTSFNFNEVVNESVNKILSNEQLNERHL